MKSETELITTSSVLNKCSSGLVEMSSSAYNNNTLNNNNSPSPLPLKGLEPLTQQNGFDSSSKMQNILDEFSKLYTEKVKRVYDTDEDTNSCESLQKKISILESWVEDLSEQNNVLVSTVEELEKEAKSRVSLLQDKLEKMALATKESCISLRDHQAQVTSLISEKVFAEDELERVKNSLSDSERSNTSLAQENLDLKDDLDHIIQIITDVRLTGKHESKSTTYFKCVERERIFGTTNNTSLSIMQEFSERVSGEKMKRRKESYSSLGSLASTDTDEENNYHKLRSELKSLRQTNQQTNVLLMQRDSHIADLQSQLTEIHHQLAVSQTELDNATSAMQTLRDRGRQDTFEICRRDDVIRQLLSPSRTFPENKSEYKDKPGMEVELGENIDVMAARLSDLEEECQHLRHENLVVKASHAHCAATINQLHDQLSTSHMSLEDLRTVLTTEVTERHDTLSGSRVQLQELRSQYRDTVRELQIKNEIIKKLNEEASAGKSTRLMVAKSDECICMNSSDQTTQTEEVSNHLIVKDSSSWPDDSESINLSIKISRLENELSEKNILLRELQNHLSSSRQELYLKDETIYNIEQKLDSSRRDYDEKEDRMIYLTSQLTNLQLEVSKLHGSSQQLRLQLENKSKLVQKLEAENDSLCWQLNDKSSIVEKLHKDFSFYEKEIDKRKREASEQKLTIATLQDALVATKHTCEKLRQQYEIEGESRFASMTSLPSPSMFNSILSLKDKMIYPSNVILPKDVFYKDASSQYSSLMSHQNDDVSSLLSSTSISINPSTKSYHHRPFNLSNSYNNAFKKDISLVSNSLSSLTSEVPLTTSSQATTAGTCNETDSLKSLEYEQFNDSQLNGIPSDQVSNTNGSNSNHKPSKISNEKCQVHDI